MYKEQVKRGIELLDREQPGWREKININDLHMVYCEKCVLGHLFGSFTKGILDLGKLDVENVFHYGFDIPTKAQGRDIPQELAYYKLEQEWKRQLTGD